jgi:hypothetical protein
VRKHKGTRRRKSYGRSLVLLVVAAGFGVLAVVVLVRQLSTPKAAPGSYALVVDTGSPDLTTLNVTISRDTAGDSVFDIQAALAAPMLNGTTYYNAGPVLIDLSYPTGASGNTYTCEPPAHCQYNKGTYLPLRVTLADNFARIVFRGPPLGFDYDDTAATAELPAVQVALDQQFLIGAVEVHYTLPNASKYDWTTGQRPVTTTGNVLTWYLNLQSQGAASGAIYQSVASSAGGVDQSALQRQQFLIFVAGALIGLAGGALIGALQEFLDARAEAKRARQEESAVAA